MIEQDWARISVEFLTLMPGPPFPRSAGRAIFTVRGNVLPLVRVQVRDGPALLMGFAVAWVYLVIAGLLEIAWTYAMKQSDGFTRP